MRIHRTLSGCAAAVVAATLLAGCGSASGKQNDADDAPESTVRERLEKLVADDVLIGGEVTIRDGDDFEHVRAGLGDRETDAEYPSGAHTRVASVTKAFTASMVLQLVAEGEVELDTPIEEYLPGLLRGEGVDAEAITVKHLLRHQSGLPQISQDAGPRDPKVTYTPRDLIDMALEHPAQFEPGEKMVYTNTNYVVAGMLVEEITGDDFRTALAERVTEPLRLDGTYLPKSGDTGLAEPHPRGYFPTEDGGWRDVTEADATGPWASGGMVSTGEDLNTFFTALARGEVVEAAQLERMRDTVPLSGVPGVDYGLGLMRLPVECDVTLWGQAGDVPGFQAMTAATADGSASVSITVNQSPGEDFGPEQLLGLLDAAMC